MHVNKMLYNIILVLFNCVFHLNSQYLARPKCPFQTDCTWKFPSYITENIRCVNDFQCPLNFLCCNDCHYEHKVCKTPIWIAESFDNERCPATPQVCTNKIWNPPHQSVCALNEDCPEGFVCCKDRCYVNKVCKQPVEFVCPEDSRNCLKPLPYEETKIYRCVSHLQCYKDYVCCKDSCYTHKICKPKASLKLFRTCPMSVRKELCLNSVRKFEKYRCVEDADCIFDYVCCQDNCYDHKVCKLPIEAFEYHGVYKPVNFTTTKEFSEKRKCPDLETKCTIPYSLRLAKKFICFKNDDCKIGQLCCKDSCIKDFKICKNVSDTSFDRFEPPTAVTTESLNSHVTQTSLFYTTTLPDISGFPAKEDSCDDFNEHCHVSEPTKNPYDKTLNNAKEFYFDESNELHLDKEDLSGSGSGYYKNDVDSED